MPDASILTWLLLATYGTGVLMMAGAGFLYFRSLAAQERPVENFQIRPFDKTSEVARQLMQAGFSNPAARQYFLFAKVTGLFVGLVIGLLPLLFVPMLAELPPSVKGMFGLSAAAFGYFVPVLIVDRRRERFRRRIALAVPDALDLMLVCVEAGQSIDFAVARAARQLNTLHPDLAKRLDAVSEALAAGADRHEALMRLAQETDNDDLRSWASIIVQTVNLGTPVAQTFRIYSSDLRDRHVREVEAKVNMLPTKMTLGTMLFTLPPLLILLLAPAVYRIAYGL